jgi:hypothetical protein
MENMINSIAPYKAPNVPNRDVSPVRAVANVELNPNFSKNEYFGANSKANSFKASSNRTYNNYNPFFAAHILVEAGETEFQDTVAALKAYQRPRLIEKNLIAII